MNHDKTAVFYFGCWGRNGHYIWTPSGGWPDANKAGPWSDVDLDYPSYRYRYRYGLAENTGRGFAPVDPRETQGVWRLTTGQDAQGTTWTALGCYDRTQDHRSGSKSVFVAEGEHDEAAMKTIAAKHFPAVWARIQGAPT